MFWLDLLFSHGSEVLALDLEAAQEMGGLAPDPDPALAPALVVGGPAAAGEEPVAGEWQLMG